MYYGEYTYGSRSRHKWSKNMIYRPGRQREVWRVGVTIFKIKNWAASDCEEGRRVFVCNSYVPVD